jgi:hypothetical protein
VHTDAFRAAVKFEYVFARQFVHAELPVTSLYLPAVHALQSWFDKASEPCTLISAKEIKVIQPT